MQIILYRLNYLQLNDGIINNISLWSYGIAPPEETNGEVEAYADSLEDNDVAPQRIKISLSQSSRKWCHRHRSHRLKTIPSPFKHWPKVKIEIYTLTHACARRPTSSQFTANYETLKGFQRTRVCSFVFVCEFPPLPQQVSECFPPPGGVRPPCSSRVRPRGLGHTPMFTAALRGGETRLHRYTDTWKLEPCMRQSTRAPNLRRIRASAVALARLTD